MNKILYSYLAAIFGFGLLVISAAQTVSAEDAARLRPLVSVGNAIKRVVTVIGKGGLPKLPSAAAALSTHRASSSLGGNGLYTPDVSGTPPYLTAIAQSSAVENIFWRPNVVASIAAGGADQTQCGEFFSGATDGVSGGLEVCELAEGIGFSFESIVDAQTNLCYLKSFPTKQNLQSGGIVFTRGRKNLPNHDFTQLFSTGDTTRTIKIHAPQIDELGISAQNIFLKIPSATANKKKNAIYQAEIYFCLDGETGVSGFYKVAVNDAGRLTIASSNFSDPIAGIGDSNTIQGYLKASEGTLIWDTSKQRLAAINTVQSLTDTFKSSIKITSDNLISIKRRNFYQSVINEQFSISRFTGDSAFTTAFLEGAYKGESIFNGQTNLFSGATEYRDTYYAAAPSEPLALQVNSYDLLNDPFYASGPEINTDTSRYSCAARADIEINILPDSQVLIAALEPCIENRLNGMDFCSRSTLVTQAVQNFTNACSL